MTSRRKHNAQGAHPAVSNPNCGSCDQLACEASDSCAVESGGGLDQLESFQKFEQWLERDLERLVDRWKAYASPAAMRQRGKLPL